MTVTNSETEITGSLVYEAGTDGDISFYIDDLNIGDIVTGETHVESVYLTCDVTGTNTFYYSIVGEDKYSVPSWVTIDTYLQALTIVAPLTDVDLSYMFYIKTNFTQSGESLPETVYRRLYFNVVVAVTESQVVTDSKTTAIATTGASAAVVAATSSISAAMTGSSPAGMWIMLNQFAYFMLIPLVGAFIPDAFLEFLKGYSFSLFNFKFIKINNTNYYHDSAGYFD